ncbi:ABC transporter permease [Acidiphilium iwatense]|uniref:ABC transporter permease n=1 Tax=Acidiphilium iwatense TaxID=768198 RepID=A0ABS9E2Z2_9PROT|nr:ABC transporter permease [Acidiphilium iwatense]MCF3947954.1 ABC transporter permease [Acidiphilium iwatense]
MQDHLSTLVHDASVAWRGLIRKPFYPIATIIMLVLAIGANAAAFGIFYGYDLKPLPYAHPSRLVLVREMIPRSGLNFAMTSPDTYRKLRAALPSIADAGLWTFGGSVAARIDGKPRAVHAVSVTPSFFSTLGVRPALGWLPSLASGHKGGPKQAMISYRFWQSAYSGDAGAIGKRVSFNGAHYRIVGVLPRSFGFMNPTDLWASFVLPRTGEQASNIDDFMPAELAPGVSLGQFNANLHRFLHEEEREATPERAAKMRAERRRLDARPIRQVLLLANSDIGDIPILLQGAALFLLLLAVINAANLALVRHRSRMHELALRRALGGSRLDLLRLFLLEQVPILLAIGIGGSLLGWLVLRTLASYRTVFDAPPFDIATGWPVFGFAWLLALLSSVAIAAVPLWQTSSVRIRAVLGQGSKATLTPATRRIQNALGAVQIALAAALLIGSTMLGLSLYRVLTQKLGFSPDNRIVASVLLPDAQNNAAGLDSTVHAVTEKTFTVSAGGVTFWSFPFTQNHSNTTVSRIAPNAPSHLVVQVPVTPGYFRTLGIHLAQGHRVSPAAEMAKGSHEVIISPGVAKAIFGRKDAVGHMLKIDSSDYRIVGIAAHVQWRPTPLKNDIGVIYMPFATANFHGFPLTGATVIIHYRGSLRSAMRQTKNVIETAIPGAVITWVRPYRRIIFAYSALRAVAAGMVAGFAVLALVLAALGVYAVNAFIARARLPEYGMRAMLGASPQRLLRLALTDAAWPLGFGLAGGAIGGYVLVRAMSPLLFHVGAIAPVVFVASLAVIAAIVLAAAWRPAARAANTPVKILLDAR